MHNVKIVDIIMTYEEIDKFNSIISKTDSEDDCWLWKLSTDTSGYGLFKTKGGTYKSHRIAYYLKHGIQDKKLILHKCDNPKCCNPNHLFEGDHKLNCADRDRKGRGKMPFDDPSFKRPRKISLEQIEEIKIKKTNGKTYKELALEYNVNPYCIYYNINYRNK